VKWIMMIDVKNIKTIWHCNIEGDFKRLKRYPAPKESLEAWERLFCYRGLDSTPGIKRYSGFGQEKIFKTRVIPLKENCGKSDGYRLIFKEENNDLYEILFFYRHTIYNSEREIIAIIKKRLCE